MSFVNGRIFDKHGPRYLVIPGFMLGAISNGLNQLDRAMYPDGSAIVNTTIQASGAKRVRAGHADDSEQKNMSQTCMNIGKERAL